MDAHGCRAQLPWLDAEMLSVVLRRELDGTTCVAQGHHSSILALLQNLNAFAFFVKAEILFGFPSVSVFHMLRICF